MFKIKKTNGKFKGYPYFKYVILIDYTAKPYSYNLRTERRQDWFLLREWCWETWGPSKEIDDWLDSYGLLPGPAVSQNAQWAWQNDKYSTRIYLADEKELNWFKLRWQ